jgi:hypothetical protein
MQRFFRHHDRFHVYQVKSILDEAGIPCFVRNELVQGAIGEIPPMDSEPEIWLQDDEWQPKAQRILKRFYEDQAEISLDNKNDWACLHCGQMNEYQFAICWQCQNPRISAESS